MNQKKIWIGLLVFFCAGEIIAQHVQYEKQVFRVGNDSMLYRILYPANYDSTQKYPLLLFLHGAGERGRDNEKQLTHGGKMFLSPALRDSFPAIIVFPQCPPESYWANVNIRTNEENRRTFHFHTGERPTKAMELLMAFYQHLKQSGIADEKRLYIAGLSMGAMGTFEFLSRNPKDFAAAIAICGGGTEELVPRYANQTEIWIFHGVKDRVVPVEFSERMAAAIREHGGNPRITLYPEVDHNSWDNAFAEPDLLSWLFSKTK